MEKISRELLMKEVSSRFPYGIKAQVQGWDEDKQEEVYIPLTIYSINTDGYVYFENNNYNVNYCSVEDCLLFLRTMSSMTEEEKTIYDKALNSKDFYISTFQVIDWLNAHHFDYRGLIEKGLALVAPEGMYNINL